MESLCFVYDEPAQRWRAEDHARVHWSHRHGGCGSPYVCRHFEDAHFTAPVNGDESYRVRVGELGTPAAAVYATAAREYFDALTRQALAVFTAAELEYAQEFLCFSEPNARGQIHVRRRGHHQDCFNYHKCRFLIGTRVVGPNPEILEDDPEADMYPDGWWEDDARERLADLGAPSAGMYTLALRKHLRFYKPLQDNQ